MSAVSEEGARKNLEKEIPEWDFKKIKTDAKSIWEKELKKVEIEGGSEDQKTIFYSALYHSFIENTFYIQ